MPSKSLRVPDELHAQAVSVAPKLQANLHLHPELTLIVGDVSPADALRLAIVKGFELLDPPPAPFMLPFLSSEGVPTCVLWAGGCGRPGQIQTMSLKVPPHIQGHATGVLTMTLSAPMGATWLVSRLHLPRTPPGHQPLGVFTQDASVLDIDHARAPELLGTPPHRELRPGDDCFIDVVAVGGSKGSEAVLAGVFLVMSRVELPEEE